MNMIRTAYRYAAYPDGELDPEVAAFLDGLASEAQVGASPLASLNPGELREANSILGWARLTDQGAVTTDLLIPGPGGDLPLRLYSPPGPGPFPVLVYFHGGGWVFGSLREADHVCAALCLRAGVMVVSVGYRLAPENPFPAALLDALAALKWVGEGITAYGGNLAFLGVAGESAGANLATVAARILRDGGGPHIHWQLLLCPWTKLSAFDSGSCAAFGDGPWLPLRNLALYRDAYLGSAHLAADPRVSPLLADDLEGLPPAHVVTAEFDVLRDEGEAYADRLAAAGVAVTRTRYRGMIHSFMVLNGLFAQAEEALDDCAEALGKRLRDVSNEAAGQGPRKE
jgi:acetyl esterase